VEGRTVDKSPLHFDENLIKRWISAVGFKIEDKRRKNALDVVRRLLLRGTPSKDEFKMMADIFHQNIRKLEERKDLLTQKTTGMVPIGTIDSIFKTRFGTPRQPGLTPSATAKLKIRKELQPAQCLEGLSEFSHVWLLFQFHENTNKVFRPKIHPPRLDGKTIGVFATRSPHRANPLGLSLVKLEKIDNDTLYFSGIDLIDGTPVFDIKPYLPNVESIPDAKMGWVGQADAQTWPVEFESSVDVNESLKKLITEVLERDPRPLVYKEMDSLSEESGQEHAVYLDGMDVHFKFMNDRIRVQTVKSV
jgi:tRNA-Thr(GGU) m(6)t(6)A37 methyltransferase TsaA